MLELLYLYTHGSVQNPGIYIILYVFYDVFLSTYHFPWVCYSSIKISNPFKSHTKTNHRAKFDLFLDEAFHSF